MSGATGFRYDALKDLISWHYDTSVELDEIYKEHLTTLLHLGTSLASDLKSNHK